MPSSLHETLTEMFRFRPSLVAELLSGVLGVEVPAHQQARVDPADLTDLVPTEYRADAVVVLTDADRPVLAVVVEIQLGRDAGKTWSWPVYVATLRARLRCPTEPLVVCPSAAVAAWCAGPIELGVSGSRVSPLVLGPDLVPVVTDAARARASPELTVLSALAHGADPARRDLLDLLLAALAAVEREHAVLYCELVHAALPIAARRHLEALLTTQTDETLSPFRQWLREREAEIEAEAEVRGEARGEVKALLAFLDARGVDVSQDARDRIVGCTDPAVLEVWVRRAATADTTEDLFT